MLITRNNYEEFFLDYLDGNLNPELEQEFHDFLASNPDLKEELTEMESEGAISIQPTSAIFEPKESLKQNEFALIGQPTYTENTAIAYIENDLTPEQKKEFDKIVDHNPSAKKSFLMFQKTKLVADTSVVYKEKSGLKRVLILGLTQMNFYKAISIAASFLLIFSLYFLVGNEPGLRDPGKISKNQIPPVQIDLDKAEIEDIALTTEKLAGPEENIVPEKDLAKGKEGLEIKKIKETEKTKEKVLKVENPQIDPKKSREEDGKDDKKSLMPDPKEIKKLEPQDVKPDIKKKTTPTKRMVKPVEIHSQGLLASNTEKKNDDSKFLNLRQLTTHLFKKKVLKQKEEEINNNKIDFWEIADAGVKSLNKVTKRDMKLIREYNTEGELIAYAVESPYLSFEKNLRKK
ncbi:MAG: hypothetical protein K9H64_04005 [Bacteroidales bacterium]|nr:hypothetical protein [Bacteroidales bacterium]MCF8455069.1 hypothetical protein [Bacteroidales bacterium]